MMGAIATLASGGCGATGAGAASSCAGALLDPPNSDPPNIELAVSQPATLMPTIASRMARATTGFQRRAAAASMVVTMTSPLCRSSPLTPGCRRTNPAAGDSSAGTPADSLIADSVGVQFHIGENSAHALRALASRRESCGKPTLSQDDGGDLAAVIGLLAGPRAPITEEIIGMRISAGRQGSNASDAGVQQPLRAVARQIEVGPSMQTA